MQVLSADFADLRRLPVAHLCVNLRNLRINPFFLIQNETKRKVRKKFFFEKKNQKTFVSFPKQEFHQGSIA
jgi:hypothetical protein